LREPDAAYAAFVNPKKSSIVTLLAAGGSAIKRNITPGNFTKPSPVTIAWLRSPAPTTGFYCCSSGRKKPFMVFDMLVSENKRRPLAVPCWTVVTK
jgi:hypothetical protein